MRFQVQDDEDRRQAVLHHALLTFHQDFTRSCTKPIAANCHWSLNDLSQYLDLRAAVSSFVKHPPDMSTIVELIYNGQCTTRMDTQYLYKLTRCISLLEVFHSR